MSDVSRQSGSRKERSRDDSTKNRETKTVKLKTSLKTARIHSAVENGKQTLLPCETKGRNLSKFEHNGRDGRLSVYAEERLSYNVFGHYKVIAAFQPANSVQNQLFFGKSSHKRETNGNRKTLSSSKNPKETSFPAPMGRAKNRRHTKPPETFEELILKYKAQREKNHTGKQHLEVLEMLNTYKKSKEEWSRVEREFSILHKVRGDLARQETSGSGKEDQQSSDVKLPVVKVSSVHGKEKKKVYKQDSKRLKIPKERVLSFKKPTLI